VTKLEIYAEHRGGMDKYEICCIDIIKKIVNEIIPDNIIYRTTYYGTMTAVAYRKGKIYLDNYNLVDACNKKSITQRQIMYIGSGKDEAKARRKADNWEKIVGRSNLKIIVTPTSPSGWFKEVSKACELLKESHPGKCILAIHMDGGNDYTKESQALIDEYDNLIILDMQKIQGRSALLINLFVHINENKIVRQFTNKKQLVGKSWELRYEIWNRI